MTSVGLAKRNEPAPPPEYRCSHAGCARWGSVRHYVPRWQEKPDIGELYCVAHAALHRPLPAEPPGTMALAEPAGRQGSLL